MSAKMNVPELRFGEFSGEWEEKKLGKISNNIMYGIGSSAIKYDGINKYLRITDIDESSRTFSPNPLSSPDGLIEDKYKLVDGDIVFARTGASVGKSYLYKSEDGNLIFAGFLIKFHIKDANPYFVYANTFKEFYNKWVQIMSVRSGQPGINAEEYKLLPINLPSKPEQAKIASFLSSVDSKIEQLSKKKTLLEQYKKGVMQKIFSQELRFKDDDGSEFPEWVEKKLGEVATFENGKGHEQNIDEQGRYIVVNSKFIASEGKVQKYTNNLICPVKQDSNVMVMSDVPRGKALGKCYYINTDNSHSLNQRICSLKSKGCNNKYLFYILNRNPYFLQFDSGVGQTNLRKNEVLDCPLFIPTSKLEQTKIANFLSSLDKKIELTDKELNATKEFKKALLQKMFV